MASVHQAQETLERLKARLRSESEGPTDKWLEALESATVLTQQLVGLLESHGEEPESESTVASN
jgi:hypothetical protein